MFNIFIAVPYFIIVWYMTFIFHELMHIKSQGIWMKGTIWIDKLGFTCMPDKYIDDGVCTLSGGVLTSIVSFLLVFLSVKELQFSFFTLGWVQLTYGIYEYLCKIKNYDLKKRFYLYGIVTVICLLFWILTIN